MVKAREGAKRPASPTFGYRSDIEIPPQLRADPEKIFKEYRKRGLIDPKYKNIVEWTNAVLKRSNELGYEVSATLNKMNAEWLLSDRGRNSFKKLGFTDKDIKAYNKAQAKNKLSVGPFKFKGPPIERVRYKSAEQAIADGLKPQSWWSKKKGLPFRTLQASPRAYGERIPLEMEDWFKNLEAKGTIPEGTFDKYAKWVYTVNDANKARATNFSKRVGLPKHFNKGHLAAILNNTYFGGSNDPASQVVELTLENISHGATDAISLEDMRRLDLPTNWGESAAYYMVNELGIKDNRILTGTGLPMRWSGKDMILDSDIARITRFGENADVILAETQNRIEQLAQEIEANRVAGLGDSESLKQIQSRMVDGRYIPPTKAAEKAKAEAASKGGEILGVLPEKLWRERIIAVLGPEQGQEVINSPILRRLWAKTTDTVSDTFNKAKGPLKVAAIAGGGAIVHGAMTPQVKAREQEYEEDPTWINWIQKHATNFEQKVEDFQSAASLAGKTIGKPSEIASWGLMFTDLGLEVVEDPTEAYNLAKTAGEFLTKKETYTETLPEASRWAWRNRERLAKEIGVGAFNMGKEAIKSTWEEINEAIESPTTGHPLKGFYN